LFSNIFCHSCLLISSSFCTVPTALCSDHCNPPHTLNKLLALLLLMLQVRMCKRAYHILVDDIGFDPQVRFCSAIPCFVPSLVLLSHKVIASLLCNQFGLSFGTAAAPLCHTSASNVCCITCFQHPALRVSLHAHRCAETLACAHVVLASLSVLHLKASAQTALSTHNTLHLKATAQTALCLPATCRTSSLTLTSSPLPLACLSTTTTP